MVVATGNYIRWNEPGVEHGAGPEEDKIIQEIGRLMNVSQQRVYDAHHHAFSATHVKTHGVVKGELEVLPNLPSELAQSMFAKHDKFPIAMRFSTEPLDLVPDTIPQPRGVGMKVFNVGGNKLRQDGKDPKTQDFEFNSAPAIELGNAEICRDIMALRLKYTDPAELTSHLKKRDDFEVQDARNHIPNKHVYCLRQYSQSAFRYGDYVAKFALTSSPNAPQLAKANELIKESDDGKIAFREGLIEFLAKNSLEYDFQVQLLQNLKDQDVEDSRNAWPEDKYPYITVAKVTIPPQDPFLPGRVSFWRDQLRLDPWHGREDLRPLGSINRVRKGVYKASNAYRRKVNGFVKEVIVAKPEDLPDN